MSIGKWRILRSLFTFVLACSWVLYLVLLSQWVRYHGHAPSVLVCTKHSGALRFEGLTLHLCGDSTLWKPLEKPTVSPRVPPIFVVIIVFFFARHSIGHLTLLSRLLFHRVSTLWPRKLTLPSDLLTCAAFKSISCTTKKLPVKKLNFLLHHLA